MTLAQQFEAIGMKKGMQQGMQQDLLEGERTVLLRQIQRKFGTLPASYRQKIESADVDTLSVWIDAILDAEMLDEIFQ